MITLHQIKDEFSEFLINCVEDFSNKKGNLKAIGVSLYESTKQIQIHFNTEKAVNKKDKTSEQFEYKNEYKTTYQMGQPDERGFVYDLSMWVGIRNATRKVYLPTVLCCFEEESKNYFAIESELEIFGRAIVKLFREEPMEFHESNLKRFTEQSIGAFASEEMESVQFFNSLNSVQKEFLNRYIKEVIDFTSFNVMRAIDEKTGFEESDINIDIRGVKATDLPLIGNGNLSGEYFDWTERFSKYGKIEI